MTPQIAIVGAGIAGLNAALTLRDAGLPCSVYEASHRIGGRMHSDAVTWADGMVSEWCGEFIGSDHTTLHQLITRFGLSAVALDRGSACRAPSLMYFRDRYYGAEELTRDFQALAPLLRQQLQEAGFPTTHAHFTQAGLRLDHLRAYEWIERHVAGGHGAPVGRFLDAACTGFYGLDTVEQSASIWSICLARAIRRAVRSHPGQCKGVAKSWAGTSNCHWRLPAVCRRGASTWAINWWRSNEWATRRATLRSP